MKGFTLVEMLVALLIFGFIAAAGASVLGVSLDNREVMQTRTKRLGEIQRARAALKADLAQAAARRTRAMDGRIEAPALSGGAQAAGGALLQLVRRGWDNPDAAPRASLQAVQYRVDGGRLERRTRPALDGAPYGTPQVLLSGVEAADVAFLIGGQWTTSLPPALSQPLPEAVRVDLTLADYGRLPQIFLVSGAAR